MQDRVPLYPGRVKLTPVSGQANTFDLVRADQPTQEGTPLNKASLLKDATAALFGLGADAVPDDVLDWLGAYNQYWWSLTTPAVYGYTEVRTTDANRWWMNYTQTLYCSKSISIDQSNGAISLVDPVRKQTGTSQNDVGVFRSYLISNAPIYISGIGNSIFLVPSGISNSQLPIEVFNEDNGYWGIHSTVNSLQKITSQYGFSSGLETSFLHSASRDAYPDSGTDSEGNIYCYLGIPFENAVLSARDIKVKARIATGSYTGTGTYGASNPNSLTFEFEPKAIFMWAVNNGIRLPNELAATTYIAAIPANNVYYYGGFDYPGQTRGQIKRSIDGKTITWYSTGPGYQLNSSNITYYYLAIG